MILGSFLALSMQQSAPPSGAAIISKMFAYYANANSFMGAIHMTQRDQNITLTIDTTIAYQAPSKIYVKQVLNAAKPEQWLITSDGQTFTYDYPNSRRKISDKPEPGRLWESVAPLKGKQLDYRQIFLAAYQSLGDVSIPEFVAIAGPAELEAARNQIATINYAGVDTVDGQAVDVVMGDWRMDAHAPVTGKYRMSITHDGQLKQFSETEMIDLKLRTADSKPQTIVTTWDVDLHPRAQPDPALFTVVK